MNTPSTITYKHKDANTTTVLWVEEYQPYEPSAYCYSPGWVCYDPNTDVAYFIDETGDVWKQPENEIVGVAPEIKAAADKMEAALTEAAEQWAQWEQSNGR